MAHLDTAPLAYAVASLMYHLVHAIGPDRPIVPGDAVSPDYDPTLVGTYLGRTEGGSPVVIWE